MALTETELAAKRDQHEQWLNQQPGITGTGIGVDRGGRLSVKVYTNRMPEATKQAIVNRLRGIPVDFEETGEFHALPASELTGGEPH